MKGLTINTSFVLNWLGKKSTERPKQWSRRQGVKKNNKSPTVGRQKIRSLPREKDKMPITNGGC